MIRPAAVLSALLPTIVLGACAVPTMPGPSLALGPEPTIGAGLFNTGGGLAVAAEAREIDGRLAVCGAWASGRQSVLSEPGNRQVLESGSVYVDGERVLQGLGHLPETALDAGFQGARAACAVSERAWDPAYATAPLSVRLPRQIIANESDGDPIDGGGLIVRFRQTQGLPTSI